jgi:hypothetical protein
MPQVARSQETARVATNGGPPSHTLGPAGPLAAMGGATNRVLPGAKVKDYSLALSIEVGTRGLLEDPHA